MDGGGPYGNLNPFPGNLPTIVRFEDKVEVLSSLVRPKKVTVLASDGHKYIMMCKPEVRADVARRTIVLWGNNCS